VTRAKPIRRLARAKVNLFLRVLDARDDGYHDIESLIVPTSLADEITIRPAGELRVTVTGGAQPAGDVPAGGLNLALVAALALADECGEETGAGGATIEIAKRIPVASGLGGGSADAAATLDALRELWGCGLDEGSLAELASRVGSDVPAMLSRGPVLVRGRGDVIEPATVERLWLALVCFDFGVRSPDAYRWWDEDRLTPGPDPAVLLQAATKGDVEALGPLLFNDLERAVFPRYPAIEDAKGKLLSAGAIGAVMSGSGSSVVGLAMDEDHATELARAFPDARVLSGPP
jgi:4-diphosphocytidyl-2-C-methyl-D-erythritol kinase